MFKVGFLEQEWTQILAILTAALVGLNTGLLYAWPSPSIPIIISEQFPSNVTLEEASYVTVIPAVASIMSSPFYPYFMAKFGRKPVLLSVAVPQVISWVLVALADNIYIIYVSRFFSGFATSCLYSTLPVYIGEVASPSVRGLWGNAMSCWVYFGCCLMNIVGGYYSMKVTAYIFGVLPVFFFLIFIFMPESPYYYIAIGDLEKAKKNLSRLRKRGDVDDELLEIKSAVERQLNEPGSFKDLFTVRSNLKSLLIVIAVRGAQQYSGISAFSVYAQYIFLQAGDQISGVTSAIIFTGTMTVACCTGSIFLDRLGRRLSMVISSSGCAVILLSEAGFFYYKDSLVSQSSWLSYIPLTLMLLYVPMFSLGIGILPNLLLGEIFSSNIKGKALCLAHISFCIYSSSSTKVFQILSSNYGMYSPFVLFGSCCVLSTIFSILCIPETSGKTLEQIQQDLKGKNKSKDSTKL